MNRLFQFAIACYFSLVVFAANPSFQSFNTTQFDVTGNRVALTNGTIITNLVVAGATANLLEVLDENSVLKSWIDTDGYFHPQAPNATNSVLIVTNVTIEQNITIKGNATMSAAIVTNSLTVYSNTYVSNFYAFTGVVSNNLTVYGNTALNTATAQSLTVTNNLTVQGSYQGTIDPSASGTTLNVQKSLKLQFPRYVDNAGCTYANTNDYSALTFMLPQFSGTAAASGNYCDFAFRVPADLDTSKDLTGSLTIRLTAADTAAHAYDVGMVSIANSGAAAGTPGNYVTLTISADGSGASGDIESVSGVTLTSWRSNMTAGQWCLLRLRRDGTDASTVASNLMELEIFYWATQ